MARRAFLWIVVASALLSLAFPWWKQLKGWEPGSIVAFYQTILLFWTLVGAGIAALFAARSWRTALDALHVSNYLALSDQWNQTFERISKNPEGLGLLRRQPEEVTPEERKRASPLIQEILTSFDAWLVQNQLKAFPIIGDVQTWNWWWETIVGYFVNFPLLSEAERNQTKEGYHYSPWLTTARKEAEKRLPPKAPKIAASSST